MKYQFNTKSPIVRLELFRNRYGIIAWLGLGAAEAISLFMLVTTHNPTWLGSAGLILSWLIFLRLADWTNKKPDSLEDLVDSELLALLSAQDTLESLWQKSNQTNHGNFLLQRLGLNASDFTALITSQDHSTESFWQKTDNIRQEFGFQKINGAVILAGILEVAPAAAALLPKMKITATDIKETLAWLSALDAQYLRHKPYYGGFGRDWAVGFTPLLDRYGSNLSRQSESARGALHLSGHDDVIEELVTTLERSSTSLAMVGEIGIGKTSLLYGVADALLQGRGDRLAHYQIVSLNAAVLLAEDTNLENLLLSLFSEAVLAGNIIIALDEAQLFFGHGTGAVNLSQILLPILQGGRLPLMLTLNPNDWIKLKNTNAAIASLLTPVMLKEMNRLQTIQVLGLRSAKLDNQHGTVTLHSALDRAYELSGRYMPDESYPGRAIKLLEASFAHSQNNVIDNAAIDRVVEAEFGIKVGAAGAEEADQLLHLEEALKSRMVGQEHAITAVSAALRRARAGISSPKRPLGSFLFLGPTGVGKTELSKSLAAVVFGSPDRMVRLDMSEYSQSQDVSRILSDSSEGGLLNQVRRNPYSVVLLDEIEKSDTSITNLLLQLLDEGHLTDALGKTVSFKDCIIIATSNAGAEAIAALPKDVVGTKRGQTVLIDKLIEQKAFKPELLNRFDEVILFSPLSEPDLLRIVDLLLAELNVTMSSQNLTVALTDAAKKALVKAGYDPRFGARPMRRIIQTAIQDIVAKRVLAGNAEAGNTISFDVSDLELSQ